MSAIWGADSALVLCWFVAAAGRGIASFELA
jgi:hypothetical protein